MNGRLEAKNISLDVGVTDDVLDTLEGDPARIKQLLLNLIGNGIKFTDKGGVSLNVTLDAQQGDDLYIRFQVTDTGIGISPDAQARLFQKFTQADTSTTRRYGGTGLGLAICKQLVDLMQGEIHLTSELGEGSCFTFKIPFKLGSKPINAHQAQLQSHSHQLHILCAEDFLPNQIIIQGLLEEMGHRAEFVDNGRKALEALPLLGFDLILMDGRMPEMDGAAAIRLIRAGGEGKFHIPNPQIRIIMLTANVDEESRQFYLSCGADDFLVKPIDETMLHQSLSRAIDARLSEGASLLPLLPDTASALESLFGATATMPQHVTADAPTITPADDDADMKPSLKQRMTDVFRADLPRRLEELELAFSNRDSEALAHLFHGLKGSAGYIWPGGDLQQLSARLEKAADQGDWHSLSEKTPTLLAILQKILEGAAA